VGDDLIMAYDKEVRTCVAGLDLCAGIVDFTDVSSLDIASQTVHVLARSEPVLPNPAIPRFIVAPSPHVFGMSRMFQILGGDKRPTLYVVSSLDEVYAAIGVKQLHFEPLQLR